MEVVALCPSSTITTFNTTRNFSIKLRKILLQTCNFCPISIKLHSRKKNLSLNSFSFVSTVSSPIRTNAASATSTTSTLTTPPSTTISHNHHWIVSMETPPQGVNSRPQVLDYYVKTLKSVLGNEKDAQMCIYHASWDTHFGFCCDIDEETSLELARENLQQLSDSTDSSAENVTANIETKKLFVAGLSFYTSEKTLRAAFEGFGELVQVKVIMDKISKRSKGYAFIEYTTKEAAAAALKEMNGKIINGWMITVDVARRPRTNPPTLSRGQHRPAVCYIFQTLWNYRSKTCLIRVVNIQSNARWSH